MHLPVLYELSLLCRNLRRTHSGFCDDDVTAAVALKELSHPTTTPSSSPLPLSLSSPLLNATRIRDPLFAETANESRAVSPVIQARLFCGR